MGDRHRLVVLRHAKAGELPGGPDFERALLPSGQRDSAAAGSWLASQGFRPDSVICSPTRRTRQTWENVAPALGGDPEFIAEERLYEADPEDLFEIIRQTPAAVGTLLYIGHNPAAAKFASLVTGSETVLPDAATAVIGLDGDWADLAAGRGDLLATWSPNAEGSSADG
ncbi:MAG TPA: histidine phosphatase family protein [Streptosporangiaceae bacterium]|nr:histidine phosphatase family protein [Streptosporangiaceae bacterium]